MSETLIGRHFRNLDALQFELIRDALKQRILTLELDIDTARKLRDEMTILEFQSDIEIAKKLLEELS